MFNMIDLEDIQEATALFEDGDPHGVPIAEDIMRFASSDDWKNRYCDELYDLKEAINLFLRRNPRFIARLHLWED
jgi:hypothetical protein